MKVYVVLYDRFLGWNEYCETEIVDVYASKEKAELFAEDCEFYRVEEWDVTE